MKRTIYLVIILTFTSCEKQIDWNLQSSGNQYLIVESIITNENKTHFVKISKSSSDINMPCEAVSGANVVVSDGENYYIFLQDSIKKEYYFSVDSFIAVVNKRYKLEIIYGGETYTALAQMEPVLDFSLISYSFNATRNMYFLTAKPNRFTPNENAMYKVNIDWSNLAEYENFDYEQTHQLLYFYSLSSIDVPEIFSPQSEEIFFPKGSIITQRKYSLTQEHADFIRSLLLETTWRGGIFDLEQGNVISNITNNTLGFFAVCSVIEKQFVVE